MITNEFDQQVENLIQKGYPAIAGLNEDEFRNQLQPLKTNTIGFEKSVEDREGYIPYVIVIKSEWVDGEKAMQLVERKNQKGFSVMDANDIQRFKPIEGIELPNGIAYLAMDIDTGTETRNVTPNEALKTIVNDNRSPLTLEEGIAVITHNPDILMKNRGFSLLGSRCGDRRVTALWISAGKPKLGWCWAGNPHTWLGSASCSSRVGM
ncbi:hypothetical protein SAMN05661091_2376 [Paenibacillus uliginis N3/975]|uniref:Uncharacterized protein n=1 Tax=Paenibacillus uliginis N3/975 TaxID=1313296 RepID=A0A1X7HBM0_9BACL|nr:DUF5701 family protein [Paenibacillus uliginis]SMF83422.1 hypothetical protein SAMN05661091_2376 [Paenibacillus uliginis N3/975]